MMGYSAYDDSDASAADTYVSGVAYGAYPSYDADSGGVSVEDGEDSSGAYRIPD